MFALDGGPDAPPSAGTGLVTLPGSLPQVGEPGHTLGGRVLPGYGFPPSEGDNPAGRQSPPTPAAPTTPTAGETAGPAPDEESALAAGARIYRARCVGCHRTGSGTGTNVFRSPLSPQEFFDMVADGIEGTNMPAFGALLSPEEIRQVRAYLLSRDSP